MRLKLVLKALKHHQSIPINYQYYLSSAIYRFIEHSSHQYASALHNGNINNEVNPKRMFKHFCFSQLFPFRSHVIGDRLYLDSDKVEWYIGIAVNDTLRHLVIGLFEKQEFFIGTPDTAFAIHTVEVLPEPRWQSAMKFRMLSPVTVSAPVEHEGKLQARYLLADDPMLNHYLATNILTRYQSLYNKLPDDQTFKVTLDAEYIQRRGGAMKVSKLITIKQHTENETKVRGFLCPLTIEGNPELIRLAYCSGLGEKGSMGFGMLEVVRQE